MLAENPAIYVAYPEGVGDQSFRECSRETWREKNRDRDLALGPAVSKGQRGLRWLKMKQARKSETVSEKEGHDNRGGYPEDGYSGSNNSYTHTEAYSENNKAS